MSRDPLRPLLLAAVVLGAAFAAFFDGIVDHHILGIHHVRFGPGYLRRGVSGNLRAPDMARASSQLAGPVPRNSGRATVKDRPHNTV